MADTEHPRLVLHNFLSPDLRKELEFIHKSCSTTGERLKEKVEEFFGCEYELFIEFTGLISWTKGASIGWHSDDNRPYLKQRDFAAVCYLNTYGIDFGGGLFHFQHGMPTTVAPMAGDVLIYTADSRNIHSVDEITGGERLTLTLWFSRDGSHDEDAKLISFISRSPLNSLDTKFDLFLPSPASNNMYWFPPEQALNYQSGFDLRCARIFILGYDLYCSQEKSCSLAVDSSDSFSKLLTEPLQLARGDELFNTEFANILHALQVMQFYCWKFTEFQTSEFKVKTNNVIPLSQLQLARIQSLKRLCVNDYQTAETIFNYGGCGTMLEQSFDWMSFSAAVAAWEAYSTGTKNMQLLNRHLPLRLSTISSINHTSLFGSMQRL